MPERPLTIATYAAGASLAAVTLVYVFGPTFFFDNDAAQSSKSSRKRGVVGLVNPANDCFINSVLQALAGLPELRIYLIQEMHRRSLDGPDVYKDLTAALQLQSKKQPNSQIPEWKLLGLQQGLVTAGLKDVLDALNERPIYKKTISAQGFIRVVEESFRTRISRTQQDAHEFLQIVAERLADECHAARQVRKQKGQVQLSDPGSDIVTAHVENVENDSVEDQYMTFPLEGKIESQVECLFCHFKPKPSVSSFVSLTLHVPQDSTTTTLNACLDGMLKVEHIDDFACDKCRLTHALELVDKRLTRTSLTDEEREDLQEQRDKLEQALHTDPETPPKGVPLPDLATAPKRRIAKHMRISTFPRILSIHLSRSVWDAYSSSSKNMAKVAFPESLPLGGLLDRKGYRLLGVVTHKGGHNSGHYESFRRQSLNAPFSTPNSMGTEGIYSIRSSPATSTRPSAVPSPQLSATQLQKQSEGEQSGLPSPIPFDSMPMPGLPSPPRKPTKESQPQRASSIAGAMSLRSSRRRNRVHDRWWRISDDKIKESKTSDVLSMQKEVYLLFYEIDSS